MDDEGVENYILLQKRGNSLHLLYQKMADPSWFSRAKFGVETNSAPNLLLSSPKHRT